MEKQLETMIHTLNEWLRSIESGGHTGDHDDCPECVRFWAILKAWSAINDLQELVKTQGDNSTDM